MTSSTEAVPSGAEAWSGNRAKPVLYQDGQLTAAWYAGVRGVAPMVNERGGRFVPAAAQEHIGQTATAGMIEVSDSSLELGKELVGAGSL